jgi:hypothetical protein
MKRRSGEIVSPSREASRYTDVFEYIKKREAEIVPRGWREGEGEEGSRQRPEREREREETLREPRRSAPTSRVPLNDN